MTFSHEAYLRPYGVEIKHSAIERRLSGFIVPRLVVAFQVSVDCSDKPPTRLHLLNDFELSALALVMSDQDTEPDVMPFISSESIDFDAFVSIGAEVNFNAFDAVKGSQQELESVSCLVRIPDHDEQLKETESDAIKRLYKITSSGLHAPFEIPEPEDFLQQ